MSRDRSTRPSLCSAVNAPLQRLPPQRVGGCGRFVSRAGSCLELYFRRFQLAASAETDLSYQFLEENFLSPFHKHFLNICWVPGTVAGRLRNEQKQHPCSPGLEKLVLSRVRLCATPWTAARQGFSRQEYCSGWPCPPPGDLPHPRVKPASPALAGVFFTTSAAWETVVKLNKYIINRYQKRQEL